MPKKAKELAEVSIRRLTHTTNSSGQPYKAVHAVGGVPGLYLQCLPPIDSETAGSKQSVIKFPHLIKFQQGVNGSLATLVFRFDKLEDHWSTVMM